MRSGISTRWQLESRNDTFRHRPALKHHEPQPWWHVDGLYSTACTERIPKVLLRSRWECSWCCNPGEHIQPCVVPPKAIRSKRRIIITCEAEIVVSIVECNAVCCDSRSFQLFIPDTVQKSISEIAYCWPHELGTSERSRPACTLLLRAESHRPIPEGDRWIPMWCGDDLSAAAHLHAFRKKQHNWVPYWSEL